MRMKMEKHAHWKKKKNVEINRKGFIFTEKHGKMRNSK